MLVSALSGCGGDLITYTHAEPLYDTIPRAKSDLYVVVDGESATGGGRYWGILVNGLFDDYSASLYEWAKVEDRFVCLHAAAEGLC